MTAVSSASLDAVDYDPVTHLNEIFTHSSTLTHVSATTTALRAYQDDLSHDLGRLVSSQAASDEHSVARIQAAKAELADLFKKIENVRERALRTEQAITEMTADIKRLDNTKKNLTLSMTALKRLQMLTTAYEQLRGLSKTRQYRECAQLLQAVLQLVAHFKSYRSIDQIATLSRNVAELQRELLEQVCEDFELMFAKGEVAQSKGMLAEACLVMDALGEHARSRLINWYCNTQLREYRQVFRGNDEAGSLDNISRRYSWFNRMLKTYDMEHATIFPAHWKVNEMLANAFCEGTRDDFKAILQRSIRRADGQQAGLDVNLLLSCLQETLNFEHSLERKFHSQPDSGRLSIDTVTTTDGDSTKPHDKKDSFHHGTISEAFEPYMSLWVEQQDKQLATLIPKYRTAPLRHTTEDGETEDFASQSVIPSSTELFNFYRVTLSQCAKLSTGSRLQELSKTFGKYLDAYSQQVLFHFLSGGASTVAGPSIEDIILVLNTADYCYTTTNQLEEKIKARVDAEFRENVDLQSQADAFIGVASAAVRALVKKVEMACEPAWREMRNTPWAKLESVGDQSTYVAELLRNLKEKAGEILKLLHKVQYSRAFCDNLVDAIVSSYINNIVASKPVSEVGAEQMLLDSYVVKKALLEIPVINEEEAGVQAPASFIKRVNTTTSKIDPLLKTLQVRPFPPEALVQAYLIHIGDRSDTNFRKILDLKGLRKPDQSQLMDLFVAHRSASSHAHLPQNSPFLTPLQISTGGISGVGGSAGGAVAVGIGSLGGSATGANLGGGKFDPATFGSAIINAARDGVDRFGSGSPALGGSSSSSGAVMGGSAAAGGTHGAPGGGGHLLSGMRDASGLGLGLSSASPTLGGGGQPGQDGIAGNLNENLRNIGKFFRRENGSGFPRFGRGGEDGKG